MTRPLYCDESIWIPVADGLHRRGWTVHTARDEDTLGEPDRKQLRYAVENDWILLTFDDDFLSLVEGTGLEHRGLIYVRQAGRQIGDVVKAVDEHLIDLKTISLSNICRADIPARDAHIAHSRANIQKAQTHLGYQPTMPLADGIETLL